MQADIAEATFIPDAENARAFRDALGRFATGIAVITTQTADGPVGFTANSFASVSLDPPLVLWSPAKSSARYPVFAEAQHYTIHILGADQADLCLRFVRGGAGFEGLRTETNAEGTPIIPGTLARFDCAQSATHDGGDHLIVVGRVLRAAATAGDPLVFSQGAYGAFTAKT
ncbi:MAG: flavin reductase family protein [Pseudorhodobacter sp.]|nr:flavin reductase family protein [Pseudorhodobacter sp.]